MASGVPASDKRGAFPGAARRWQASGREAALAGRCGPSIGFATGDNEPEP